MVSGFRLRFRRQAVPSSASPRIATAAIWERLADQHGTTVAYPTLRTYVTSHRARIRVDS